VSSSLFDVAIPAKSAYISLGVGPFAKNWHATWSSHVEAPLNEFILGDEAVIVDINS